MKNRRKKTKHKRIDSRKYARINVVLGARFVIIGDNPEENMSSRMIHSETKSISVNGACLGTNVVQADGLHICSSTSGMEKNKLKIEIDLPFGSRTITPMGEVRWYDMRPGDGKYLYYMGVSFIDLSKEDKRALETVIDKERKGEKTYFNFFRDWF